MGWCGVVCDGRKVRWPGQGDQSLVGVEGRQETSSFGAANNSYLSSSLHVTAKYRDFILRLLLLDATMCGLSVAAHGKSRHGDIVG